MAQILHVGDVGTIIRAFCHDGGTAVDISVESSKVIRLKKPDDSTEDKTAAFFTDGTDGLLQYTFVTDDLDVPGLWTMQPIVTLTAGQRTFEEQDFFVRAQV